MVIKATPQILKRVSMRWLPDPSFENTETIALNVGGYFMDLRIVTADGSLEWSRAGERKELARDEQKYQWTRIIDSLGSTQPDEAAFKSLPNGDDLEYGTFSKDGVPTSYEEVWRDVTEETSGERSAWILQSNDGSTFLGKVGSVFLGMHQDEEKNFAVRKEVYSESKRQWETVFENGSVYVIPTAASTAQIDSDVQNDGAPGGIVHVNDAEFVIRGLGRF